MNVLVIGDEHTYGFGLPSGNLSYIGHFIRQIRLAGQAVSVESYAHLTMAQVSSTLSQLPLSRYDLILLQLDYNILQSSAFAACTMPGPTAPALPYFTDRGKQVSTAGQLTSDWLRNMGKLLRSFGLPFHRMMLSVVLKQLRPYRHNVLLMTPFPHRKRTTQWLQQRSRAIVLSEAEEQLFSVFDANSVIRPQEEYFLPTDPAHLNAVSHELIGRTLFDFYLSAPTIVTVQTIRR